MRAFFRHPNGLYEAEPGAAPKLVSREIDPRQAELSVAFIGLLEEERRSRRRFRIVLSSAIIVFSLAALLALSLRGHF